jgi:hypothetical protein
MIFGRIKLYLAAAGAFVVALFAAYLRGRSDKGEAVENERLKDYAETRKRMDEIPVDDDPAVLRDWLLKRKRKRDL